MHTPGGFCVNAFITDGAIVEPLPARTDAVAHGSVHAYDALLDSQLRPRSAAWSGCEKPRRWPTSCVAADSKS